MSRLPSAFDNFKIIIMENKTNIAPEKKESLLKKAGDVVENVKEKVEEKTTQLVNKVKESPLVEKAKDKLADLKKSAPKP
jgi:hypothetical protein